jgi:hypothetical protein
MRVKKRCRAALATAVQDANFSFQFHIFRRRLSAECRYIQEIFSPVLPFRGLICAA